MFRKCLAALGLALGMSLTATPASAAVIVTFAPSTSQINVGESVSVAMTISGLGAEILSAFDINMLFDSTVIVNTAVTHDVALQWGPASVFGPSVFNTGNTEVIDYTFDDDATVAASQADSFSVLTFRFLGLADGVSTISLGLDPDFERNFVGLDALSLDVEVGSACIAVGTGSCAQVPEPSSITLAGLALATVILPAMIRRRRMSKS